MTKVIYTVLFQGLQSSRLEFENYASQKDANTAYALKVNQYLKQFSQQFGKKHILKQFNRFRHETLISVDIPVRRLATVRLIKSNLIDK